MIIGLGILFVVFLPYTVRGGADPEYFTFAPLDIGGLVLSAASAVFAFLPPTNRYIEDRARLAPG